MVLDSEQKKQLPTQSRLNDEDMEKAVKQIMFDLGVDAERAQQWARGAQETLLNERQTLVTKELVVVAADTEHISDEDVPAELVPRKQGPGDIPGTELIQNMVDSVKRQYQKVVKKNDK